MVIPNSTPYTIKRGDRGYPAWAVQRALNAVTAPDIPEDGRFSTETKRRVVDFQQNAGLVDDGIFGPKSSAQMARDLEDRVPTAVPDGLIHGLVAGESGDLIAAVNWNSPGGVDCGYCQRRVYSADFQNGPAVKRAFDGLYQMKLLGKSLRSRHDAYYGKPGAPTQRTAWELATLHHNYQYAAEKLAQGPWETPYSTSTQDWVVAIGAHFEDGTEVLTPREWCTFYIGKMTQFVDSDSWLA